MTTSTLNSAPIAVVGLGYVGCVEALYLASEGFAVVGIDVQPARIESFKKGIVPIDEPGLPEILERASANLEVTTDQSSIGKCRASLLCVGTPISSDGSLNEDDLLGAIASVARHAPDGHVIIVRSTVPPGFVERAQSVLSKAIEATSPSKTIHLACVPEFLREGSALKDRANPEMVPWASESVAAAAVIKDIWAAHSERLHQTDFHTVSMLKVVCNAWHATKVAFANEVSRIAPAYQVDPAELFRLFVLDHKLNLSAAYLRPGMPFGGACLTKDVSALSQMAQQKNIVAQGIASVLPSNEAHLDYITQRILTHPKQKGTVVLVGLGFKPGVSDLRESPSVELTQKLRVSGLSVAIVDNHLTKWPELEGITRLHSVSEALALGHLLVAAHPGPQDARELLTLDSACVLDIGGELSKLRQRSSVATGPRIEARTRVTD